MHVHTKFADTYTQMQEKKAESNGNRFLTARQIVVAQSSRLKSN